jgi:hypothetical protein
MKILSLALVKEVQTRQQSGVLFPVCYTSAMTQWPSLHRIAPQIVHQELI